MKLNDSCVAVDERPVEQCRFGGAVLVRRPSGRYELRGGSRMDRIQAFEWISMFLQDAVPRVITNSDGCNG